jgi:hypothetical protein
MGYKNEVHVGDNVSLLIRTDKGQTCDIQGTVVGVRADYDNPDDMAILLAGLDCYWISLNDNVEIGQL